MLTLPPQGIKILSSPPPSADVLDSANQLIYVALNDQILREIQAGVAEGLSVTFGGKNPVSTTFPAFKFSAFAFVCPFITALSFDRLPSVFCGC